MVVQEASDPHVALEQERRATSEEEASRRRAAQSEPTDDEPIEAEQRRRGDEAAAEAADVQRKDLGLEDGARRRRESDESVLRDAVAKEAFALPAPPAVVAQLPRPRRKVGLPLTFRDPGGLKTYSVEFKTKPLGIDFVKDAKPVRVEKAFCAAKSLGVQEGSELLSIGGINVEQMDFGQMLEVLRERLEPLQPSGLVIVFRGQGGQQRTIVFLTKPLGMDFNKGVKPIRVLHVQGAAESLGVEADWELVSIAGTCVEHMEFDGMLELLRVEIGSLPTKE